MAQTTDNCIPEIGTSAAFYSQTQHPTEIYIPKMATKKNAPPAPLLHPQKKDLKKKQSWGLNSQKNDISAKLSVLWWKLLQFQRLTT